MPSLPELGRFWFAVCAPGCQKLLKQEVQEARPELHLGFSRPGLITWKSPRPLTSTEVLGARLARMSGISLGPATGAEQVLRALSNSRLGAVHLSVLGRPTKEGAAATSPTERAERGVQLSAQLSSQGLLAAAPPRAGDWVLDVVVPPPGLEAEGDWLGCHRLTSFDAPRLGPLEPVVAPPEAPSRAYCKLEETLLHAGLAVERGQQALELGAAPGGAAYALLRRGVGVLGIDPAEMDPRLSTWATELGVPFVHCKKPALALDARDVPRQVDWLFCDMTLAPQVSLTHVAHAWSLVRRHARGAVITLKMNDAQAVTALPVLERRLQKLGLGPPRFAQLPSHRQELVAILRR